MNELHNPTTVNKRDARDYTLVQYRMHFYIRYRYLYSVLQRVHTGCVFTASSQPQPPTRARQHDAWIVVGGWCVTKAHREEVAGAGLSSGRPGFFSNQAAILGFVPTHTRHSVRSLQPVWKFRCSSHRTGTIQSMKRTGTPPACHRREWVSRCMQRLGYGE